MIYVGTVDGPAGKYYYPFNYTVFEVIFCNVLPYQSERSFWPSEGIYPTDSATDPAIVYRRYSRMYFAFTNVNAED